MTKNNQSELVEAVKALQEVAEKQRDAVLYDRKQQDAAVYFQAQVDVCALLLETAEGLDSSEK